MPNKSTTSIFRPAIVLMSGRMLGFAAAFVIPIFLVRYFSKSEFGTYRELFLVYTTLYGIAQIGMAESLFYFLPGADPRAAGRYLLNSMALLALAGLLCLSLLWALQLSIARWLSNPDLVSYLPLIGIFLLFMLCATVLEITMIARRRHLYASVTYVLSDVLRAGLCVIPAILTGRLEWLLFGLILFAALRLAATIGYIGRAYRGELRIDGKRLARQLAYAIPFSIAVLFEIARSNLHMYVVSSQYDAAIFAIYSVGCLQVPLVDFMMTSTSSVMMVRMREHLNAGETSEVVEIWRNTTSKLALLFVPLVGSLLVVADKLIVVLFTKQYSDSVPLFMIWSFTILLSMLLTDSVLRVYAKTNYLILLNLIQLLVIAGLIKLSMSWFGLAGAVLITVFAMLVMKVVALAKIKDLLDVGLPHLLPWRNLAGTLSIGMAAAVPALAVKSTLTIPDLPLLLVTGIVYVLAYAMLLLIYGPLSGEEKRALIDWARWPLRRAFQ